MARPTYGPEIQQRSRLLLKTIVLFSLGQLDGSDRSKVKFSWESDKSTLRVETTLRDLSGLTKYEGTKVLTVPQIRESLNRMEDFLEILQDDRINDRGTDLWKFKLVLWGKEVDRNLAEFDTLWEGKRSSNSKTKSEPNVLQKSGRKPGAPLQGIPLPDNFVVRPDALDAVKRKLLAESEQTLVVSAIAGLGGLGKSVLAAAIVLDAEVQARFEDGILWVTLGQQPDLLSCLGDWIRVLDKSRDAFSANTIEAASRYLGTLLAERRMLLVVDDVWNGVHAEWFRVGGAGCRVLVTTREAVIEGAEAYSLDLMSEGEASALVRGKLKGAWRDDDEHEFKQFARSLGYLPLGLDLAANQVREGLSWGELRSEFEVERRSVALELLDSAEAFDHLNEEEQRRYSLRACFNLSLRRLKPELLRQFAGLGVLPEDVSLTVRLGMRLWDLSEIRAKRVLMDLRSRSFLTDGVMTNDEKSYRVHDLMHDIARNLIEEGTIEGIQDLESAHRSFLNRYRKLEAWNELPIEEMYIFRHLTWHLEQANLTDEVHDLLAMSDEHERNAWFEACDRIGQPAIFVKSIADGWRLAEELYERENERAIVLQCRYALITATLNSLVGNLPIGMMAEFVKNKFWSVEQAWAYVEQMQDEIKIAEAIGALSPYLSKVLFQEAVNAAWGIQDESNRARVLIELAKVDGAYFSEVLKAARLIQDESDRGSVLTQLAKIDGAYFSEALAAVRAMQDGNSQARVLIELAKIDGAYFSEALEAVRAMQDEDRQASALFELVKIDGAYFSEVLAAARAMQDGNSQASALFELAKIDGAYFSEALEAVRAMQDEDRRASALIELAKVDGAYFSEVLEAVRAMQDEDCRASALIELAEVDGAYFSEALAAARTTQSKLCLASCLSKLTKVDGAYFSEALDAVLVNEQEATRTSCLIELAKIDGANFSGLLEIARTIQDEFNRARCLNELAKINEVNFSELLETARVIQDEESLADVLRKLGKVDEAYLSEALETARAIQDNFSRAKVLIELAKVDGVYFSEALEATQVIQYEYSRALHLIELTQVKGVCISELLEAARAIQDEYCRAGVLRELAKVDASYSSEALEATRAIHDQIGRAMSLSELAKVDAVYLSEALDAVRVMQQDGGRRVFILCELAEIDGAYFLEALDAVRMMQDDAVDSNRANYLSYLAEIDGANFSELLDMAQAMQDESNRAKVLSKLAKVNGANFLELLAVVRAIQDEYCRAGVLIELAKVDVAYFSEALDAARAIQDEYCRAGVLIELAKVDVAYFSEALDAARAIQDEYRRVGVLIELAQWVPQDLFPKVWNAIFEISNKPNCAEVMSSSLTRLPLATLSHSDWSSYLHILAYRKRSDLMQDLVTFYPAILHLGGDTAMRGVVNTMREICNATSGNRSCRVSA